MFGYFRISIRVRYYSFGFGYPISPNSIPVRIFCYFGSDFGSGFLDRVQMPLRISGKVSTPSWNYILSPVLTTWKFGWWRDGLQLVKLMNSWRPIDILNMPYTLVNNLLE